MARRIHSRWIISGTLVTTSPISVGGMGGDAIVDLALAQNGQGDYYIPGTSLAGALRNWMVRHCSEGLANLLFGFQPESGEEGGHASFIVVEDIALDRQNLFFEIRDGVGIDREFGAAANGAKYDRAVLPRGTELTLVLFIERPRLREEKTSSTKFVELIDEEWMRYQTAIAHMLHALRDGKIPLGAAKTRGLGRVKLKEETDFAITHQDLQTTEGILAALRYKREDLTASTLQSITEAFPVSRDIANHAQYANLVITIHWKPVEPVMVKAEGEGVVVDMLPLTSANGDRVTFVIPGSSIKGALRTQAERIVRTVKGMAIASSSNARERHIQQLQVPLVEDLFGRPAKIVNQEQQGKIGVLSVVDCYANLILERKQWEGVETADSEINLKQALNEVGLPQTKQAMHVAVDRWTGGAADGMLYSTLEPMGIDWEPIYLDIDLATIGSHQLEAIALLLLVLRDMMLAKIPLGYGTNRGMGTIAVESIDIKGEGLNESLSQLSEVTLTGGNLDRLDVKLRTMLTKKWQEWINKEVQGEAA
jgi:CRISPR/Cas system CSM-associated protein Csm3 (group 7 of RAMP superfamily)